MKRLHQELRFVQSLIKHIFNVTENMYGSQMIAATAFLFKLPESLASVGLTLQNWVQLIKFGKALPCLK